MTLSADQLGDLRRMGYRVKKVRNGWFVASGRDGWAGAKRLSIERAWDDAGFRAGLMPP